MPVLNATLQGRWGNQCLQFLFAKSAAEKTGAQLTCEDWIGNRIFDLETPRYEGAPLNRMNENQILQWSLLPQHCMPSVEFRGYAQFNNRLMYTQTEARAWLKFRPEIQTILDRVRQHHFRGDSIVAHHRLGDFIGYQYPVISRRSYNLAAHDYFGFGSVVKFVSEEDPIQCAELPQDLQFLPDFYRLMCAPTLMRANSSFSFLAGLLGKGVVLSPRIDNLVGGKEHDDVAFESGNHCRLSAHDFCSDLHILP